MTKPYKIDLLPPRGPARDDLLNDMIERIETGRMIIGDFKRVAEVLFDGKPPEHAAIHLGGVLKRDVGKRESTGTSIKLVERALPRWDWQIEKRGHAAIWMNDDLWGTQQMSNARTPGQALIAAALKVRRASWKT